MTTKTTTRIQAPISPYALALRDELAGGTMRERAQVELGDLKVSVNEGRDALWVIVRREAKGGVAIRAAHLPAGAFECRTVSGARGEPLRFEIESLAGKYEVTVSTSDADLHRLRVCTTLTPSAPLNLPFVPRDLYPLDNNDDPIGASGNVEAAQRGVNSGLVYFRLDEPAFGSVLYFQNLTALNLYFRSTGTVPKGVVGGEWPELGYLPPVMKQIDSPADPLPVGEAVVLSDAILVFRDWAADNEQEMARQFIQMLGAAYKALDLPRAEYRDWLARAERTLNDLETSPIATVRNYGHRYVMPYVEGEMPDAMVQMTIVSALHDFGKWRGEPLELEAELLAGMGRFYDPEAGTLRRYLPNIKKTGPDKDADAVDSWYLYHPMINLARLALDGDEQARTLLLQSVDYGIRSARHFKYKWPILYNIHDFSIITKARGDERFGETDVNGIYAYLMLQLYQLTADKIYLEEATAALQVVKGLRFDLMYQANLTVWGAVACMRLWRITDDKDWLAQSYVFLAGFLHNCEIWESQVGHAPHYSNFLGATCLHDAPYMAMYECFECFKGFEEYLANAGPELDPAARMMISEYCRYTLHRAEFYFPDMLPREILHQGEHQSGKLDPTLSFPLEDLYGDGQSPGQIGQEIYGAGSAFVFASRSFHRIEDAPFQLFCNHFVQSMERTGERAVSIQLHGGETCVALVSLVRLKRRKLSKATMTTADGDSLRAHRVSDDRIDFHAPADGRVILMWE
ncbi:hypothetical protein [Sphingomonas turrisvirgatae]|uniref:Uncharacterized protein n=1 Tax=Sphingomonas turrisvirgatae TaxID=1888892 RepID=A0A1E3LVG8_9SPHN|nr:hypothetical protein [Sphingomonas turrisvirgatae]ODP37752.1 hypothetical protein BFL28_01920 [Sphingomonas turrisvirgatae]